MTAVCVLHIIISECDTLQNPDLELLLYYIHSEVFYVFRRGISNFVTEMIHRKRNKEGHVLIPRGTRTRDPRHTVHALWSLSYVHLAAPSRILGKHDLNTT